MSGIRRHASKLVVAVAASAVTAVVLSATSSSASSTSSAAVAAASTSYSLTLAGTDAHSLDPQLGIQFVAGGGAGSVANPSPSTATQYFELSLNLPVGAKVTSIAVSYQYCDSAPQPVAVFGSYSPSTLVTQQVATMNLVANQCSPTTATKTGTPIATVAASRRYVIDFGAFRRVAYAATPNVVLYGATIKYTCSAPCVP
jgi:hypothetical protein